MTLVVNLYGGPGSGKSTSAAAVFAELKFAGVNVELVPEYAKDRVWEESYRVLENQIYVFGKQYHRTYRLLDKVDVIVTDSPLLLSLYYGRGQLPEFGKLVEKVHQSLDTYDIFLTRVKEYNPLGRMQTEEEAKEVDVQLKKILDEANVSYEVITANRDAPAVIAESILERMRGVS